MTRERVVRLERAMRPWAGTSGLILALAFGGSAPGVAPAGAETGTPAPLAEVNGDAITTEQLEQALGARLRKLEEQIHDLKRRQLDALIAERLLAQEAGKRGTSVGALLDAEVTGKVVLVTEQEVEAFYQANRARLRGEEADARQQIRNHLQQQKMAAQRDVLVASPRARARVVDGRPLSRAQPLEAFVRVIEEELAARGDPPAGKQ